MIQYWTVSKCHGRLGGVSFRAAGWYQKAWDNWIGWSPHARAANLNLVVNNAHFLILPGVRVPHLASYALAKAVRRLPDDWEERNGVRPQVAYTYVEDSLAATSYKAANWQCAGKTAERTREGVPKPVCMVWAIPLARGWRQRLAAEPGRTVGNRAAVFSGASLDRGSEYSLLTHPDGRVRNRLRRIVDAWERVPCISIQEIFPISTDQIAARRFMQSAKTTVDDILEPHVEATVVRCRSRPRVLAIQGTTVRDHNPLRDGKVDSPGTIAHVTLVAAPG